MKDYLNYKSEGIGPAVVLIHGFLGSMQIWDHFTNSLKNNFKIIRPDLPGHGKTGCFTETHSMEFMAEKVKEILDTNNISEAVIVGHSMGGYVALAFANLFPEILKGLILFHSHAGADNEEARLNRTRIIQVVEHDHTGFIGEFIPDLFAPENVQPLKSEIVRLTDIALSTSKEGIIAALKGMKDRKDHTKLLEKVNVPVLFIAGKKDKRIPPEIVMPQISLPDHAEALFLGNAGHMGFAEAPKQTVEVIKDFCLRALA